MQESKFFRSAQYDLSRNDLSLHWKDRTGKAYGSLQELRAALIRQGHNPIALMNAGIYDQHYRPLGLHIENGRLLRQVNRAGGRGNFFLKPNGIFSLASGRAKLVRTENFKLSPSTRLAVQSGPLLFDANGIHPAFGKNSPNRHIRNAIGLRKDGAIAFTISRKPVTFWELASYLRDTLGCRAGLYLDGAISQFWQTGDPPPPRKAPLVGILAITRHRA